MTCLPQCLNSVLNAKGLVGTFNQEKALVGAFSVIVKSSQEYLRTAEKLQMTGDVCSPHVTLCWCRLQWAGWLRWVRGGAGRRDLQAAVSHQPGPVHSKLPPHHHPL